MARLHVFEWEDQAWFPPLLRRYMTDLLDFAARVGAFAYEPFTDRVAEAMRRVGTDQLVDLCTGSGGPLRVIIKQLTARGVKVEALATDLFPNPEAMALLTKATDGKATFVATAVDATAVPAEFGGVRILCNAFHHFSPTVATEILRDAAERGRAIAVFEIVSRTPAGFFGLTSAFLLTFFGTPFMRPLRFSRFLLTYVVPAVPFFTLWDGFVSCLRVYSPTEMRALIAAADPAGLSEWTSERVRVRGPVSVTLTVGIPRGSGR